MARARKPKPNPDISTRRGVFYEGYGNSWWMTLVQVPGRDGPVDLDAIVDRLVATGVVGEYRRDVGAEILAGAVPVPAGRWAVLVALPGQPWAYLAPSTDGSAADLAERSGLRTLGTGHQKTANATGFEVYEGDETLVSFEATGMSDDEYDTTEFRGTRFPAGWCRQFDRDSAVQEALAREFDAYVPYIGAYSYGREAIELHGFDRHNFRPGDFLRVDLIGFGPAGLVGPPAAYRLRTAIAAGDVAGIHAAVAAGADLRTLPGRTESPLAWALGTNRAGKRRDRVATLLELGADVANPDGEAPIHLVLAVPKADQAEVIGVLAVLLDHGAPVNGPGRDWTTRDQTPLHVAARHRWLAVAGFLIARGADLHAVDGSGQTPRQVAERVADLLRQEELAEPGDAAMVAFLLDAEAEAARGGASQPRD